MAAVDTNVARVLERVDGTTAQPRARCAAARPSCCRRAGRRRSTTRRWIWERPCARPAPRVAGPAPCGRVARRAARVRAARRGGAGRPRFQDTDRYVRGRIVAQLVAGETPVDGYPDGRFARAVAGLERDGLIVAARGPAGPALIRAHPLVRLFRVR